MIKEIYLKNSAKKFADVRNFFADKIFAHKKVLRIFRLKYYLQKLPANYMD